jgi:hypothetical protein
MRLWSIHPKYLDTKGLVGLWREALLAKHVLENKTKGYKNHPQLIRFKNCSDAVHAINYYLSIVHEEAEKRGYRFDKEKIDRDFVPLQINVTKGQVEYEANHLKRKLQQRDPIKFKQLLSVKSFILHPLFKEIPGAIEDWEII